MTDSMAASTIVGVMGCGVTGSRVVGHLVQRGARVAVYDPHAGVGVRRLGVVLVDAVTDLAVSDVVVMCQPGPHAELADAMVASGAAVVSVSDDLADLRDLLALDGAAARRGVPVVVGAGMAPGLSGLLAHSLVRQLHTLDELHVAIHGTAGPACARQHHDALGDTALGWHDSAWIEPPGGSGRDLVWFPEPIGAHDCYRAALGDPLLLQRSFPSAVRITARASATRRDRLTARLPMLTPPHASGSLGAVRVEARGANEHGHRTTLISGAAGHTADLAAAVATTTAVHVVSKGLAAGVHSPGDDSLPLLHEATGFGVRVQEFTGVARATSW